MESYISIVKEILDNGEWKDNRTGVRTKAIAGAMFKHDMKDGFPLLTTKKMPFKMIKTELEFFIKGLTDKNWLKERKNYIWNEWANPTKAPYGHSEEEKQRMADERDLGPIYGFQWRHFGANYENFDSNYDGEGIDQLKNVVEKLKTNPLDRRMIVSAWNPLAISKMALPPCHYGFQVTVINNKLNLMWNQRSVDTLLGLPFNIASYGLLLHLLAKQGGFEEGMLIGFLGDVHIYENHIEGALEQIIRTPLTLPKVKTSSSNIFEWTYEDTILEDYESHPKISFDIAV